MLSGNAGRRLAETEPEQAYNLWAASYDAQPDNLMLAMDEEVFSELLSASPVNGRIVVDVGCGTGRHWPKLLAGTPQQISGYDVSEEMLRVLRNKLPGQRATLLYGNLLQEKNASVDIVVSTLALAHMPDPAAALAEWVRVLKPRGDIIITDYHPGALEKGANRTFHSGNQLVAVKSYVHSIDRIYTLARQLNLDIVRFMEKKIDASVRHWYEQRGATGVYEKFKGTPIIYGIHLRKNNVDT